MIYTMYVHLVAVTTVVADSNSITIQYAIIYMRVSVYMCDCKKSCLFVCESLEVSPKYWCVVV